MRAGKKMLSPLQTDVESEWEDEEVLVYAELDESLDVSEIRSAHVLGIDSASPVLQLDDNFFAGKYVPAAGTYLFFEEEMQTKSADPLFDPLPEKNLKYVCKSSKLLSLGRVYLTAKEGKEQNALDKLKVPDDKLPLEDFSSLEEVLAKFEAAYKEPEGKIENVDMASASET